MELPRWLVGRLLRHSPVARSSEEFVPLPKQAPANARGVEAQIAIARTVDEGLGCGTPVDELIVEII